VGEEFYRQRTPTASGVEREQGQAARQTPAKSTGTVPLEFKDTATGEHFDIVQDDRSPCLSDEPGDETSERVYARPDREV
jgi:hypothetical protein